MNKTMVNWKKYYTYFAILDNDTMFKFIPPYIQKFKRKWYNVFLILRQDDIGNRKVNLPDNIKWIGNKVPTLSKFSNAVDIITLYYHNKDYYAIATLDMR